MNSAQQSTRFWSVPVLRRFPSRVVANTKRQRTGAPQVAFAPNPGSLHGDPWPWKNIFLMLPREHPPPGASVKLR